MKLPENTQINREKLTKYLLALRKRNDKSKWLAQVGYTPDNWYLLEADLRNLLLKTEATFIEESEYGKVYEIVGKLLSPTGKILSIRTIWMTESATKITKFITMYPDKRTSEELNEI
jgi:hypothetical protein